MKDRYRHPLVRSLAWLIGSPGLIVATPQFPEDRIVSDTWCADALADARPWLMRQETDPAALEAAIMPRRIARVGRLAEALLAYWIAHGGRFELLAQNLAVRDGGRTLGDFDLLLRDRATGLAEHWELTVKFYLKQPQREGFAGYVGPAGEDILADKAARVFGRQLELGATPQGHAALAALGLDEIQPRAFFKGWLFYPDPLRVAVMEGVNPAHCRGWWRRHDTDGVIGRDGHTYRVVERAEWLGGRFPGRPDGTVSAGTIDGELAAHFSAGGTALMLAEFDSGGAETGRGFVLPAGR